jgi:excinuclease ABC subunit C
VLDEAQAPTAAEAPGPAALLATPLEGVPTDGLASRIEQPQPPPIDRRGGSALAFGVLKRDEASASLSETELAVLEADADASLQPEEGSEAFAEEFPVRPDLVLIDGGRGQLGVAQSVLDELGITGIALVGVAKGPDRDAGREHFHFAGRDRPLLLEPRDPVLYFVQRLRDEAHRFAIGTHRAKRAKAISANPLDEIAGIGSARKRALLEHFGSAKAVSRASPDDLVAVSGISRAMAQTIYDFFHERGE